MKNWTDRAIKGYARQVELMAREYPDDKAYQDYLLTFQAGKYDIESRRDKYYAEHGSMGGYDYSQDGCGFGVSTRHIV